MSVRELISIPSTPIAATIGRAFLNGSPRLSSRIAFLSRNKLRLSQHFSRSGYGGARAYVSPAIWYSKQIGHAGNSCIGMTRDKTYSESIMTTVGEIGQFINEFAPVELAEEWDNVGLLVGDSNGEVENVMTCLTITPESAAEAIAKKADVIVAHHPLPFRAMKRLTTANTASRLLLDLIKADVAIISPHTGFDSAAKGINSQLAEKFQLTDVCPLVASESLGQEVGAARTGSPSKEATLQLLIDQAKSAFGLTQIRFVGSRNQPVTKVALCCGSGGTFLDKAIAADCDALITGETTFHTCLEAKANGVALILLGHHNSERFAVESLAKVIGEEFSGLNVWASEDETDPVRVG